MVRRVERRVEQSRSLLNRMAQDPKRVIDALEASERSMVMEELRVLASRAGRVRRGSELLALADDVLKLVTARPALEERFRVTVRRTGTQADIDVMLTESHVLACAAQIDNSVAELGKALQEELASLSDQACDDAGS